jgi:hypothetical protein
VGENGPELFVPGSSGQVLSNSDTRAAFSPNMHVAAPNVGITVVNVTDPKEVADFLSTGEGQKVVVNVIRRNRRAVRDAVA